MKRNSLNKFVQTPVARELVSRPDREIARELVSRPDREIARELVSRPERHEPVARELVSRPNRHKKIRLPLDIYKEQNAISYLTICTKDREQVFENPDFSKAIIDLLIDKARDYQAKLFAFCLMTDHLHLLISPGGEVGVIDFIQRFKSLSTRLAWNLGKPGKLWQTSFYDRFLRKDEQLSDVVYYILENPVRKGIVSDWRNYQYCGSLELEL